MQSADNGTADRDMSVGNSRPPVICTLIKETPTVSENLSLRYRQKYP